MNKYFFQTILFVSFLIFISGCLGGESSGPIETKTPDITKAPTSTSGSTNLVSVGEKLFSSKQCGFCHKIDDGSSTGPSLKGVFGRIVKLNDGSSIQSDEAYLKESILNPDAKIVEGYTEGVMTSIITPNSITNQETDALIAFLKTV